LSSSLSTSSGLPPIRRISLSAPLRWLGGAWSDLVCDPLPLLAYGLGLTLLGWAWIALVYVTHAAYWVYLLTCGLVFVAPLFAMGLYEAGRRMEQGERPTLGEILFVRRALRQDMAYLGLSILMLFFVWGSFAQIVYGLVSDQAPTDVAAFTAFVLTTPTGRGMLIFGTLVGGIAAFAVFCFTAVSAPMLLDRNNDFFLAVVTSVRAVICNFAPMALWAGVIAILLAAAALTGLFGLVIVFPWLGLASWRAYRDLVVS
jgi:uncharacterized membrane protein